MSTSDPAFFSPAAALSVEDIAAVTGAIASRDYDRSLRLRSIAPLDAASPDDVSFLDNPHYLPNLAATRAGAVLVGAKYADRVPSTSLALVVKEPYRAFAQVAARFYPTAARPRSIFKQKGVASTACVHPAAHIDANVTLDPGVVVGPGASIGANTVVGANTVIGAGVRIGEECAIGPNVTLQHCLIANRVIIHPGAQVGQDGFGFAMGSSGHLKVPQIGRVIIGDDVEIGACTTIDRGANRDTIVGEGTKIDNQVQIGHNVVIGRHCVLVGKVGIAGSAVLEDFVVMGGASGAAGHIRIGKGAQIAGASHVKNDVPPGARMAGTPAKPLREWAREMAAVRRFSTLYGKDGKQSDEA